MENSIVKAQVGLTRCEQNLQQLFTAIHLFGHENEGGFDDITLEGVRGIMESMRLEFKLTRQLLDKSLGLHEPPPAPVHSAIIKQFKRVN